MYFYILGIKLSLCLFKKKRSIVLISISLLKKKDTSMGTDFDHLIFTYVQWENTVTVLWSVFHVHRLYMYAMAGESLYSATFNNPCADMTVTVLKY